MNTVDDMVFLFNDRKEAQAVLDAANAELVKYDFVTLADIYALCDVSTQFADTRWGWTTTTDVKLREVKNAERLVTLTWPAPQPRN